MKLQEGGCCVAGTSSKFAGVRSLGDAEQQADHQIAIVGAKITQVDIVGDAKRLGEMELALLE